jgi:hypothetical protein
MRSVAEAALIVLFAVSLLASIIGVWAVRTVYNTDAWVAAVGDLPAKPEVADALATRIVNELADTLDIKDRLSGVLPPNVLAIAAPIATTVRNELHDLIVQALQSSQFHDLWVRINQVTHDQIIKLLEGGSGPVLVQNGTVTLNLLPLMSKALNLVSGILPGILTQGRQPPTITPEMSVADANAALSTYIGRPLQPDFGQIQLFSSDQLAAAQTVFALAHRIVAVAIIVTVLLAAAAIAVARRRLRALIWLAFAAVLTVVLAGAGTRAIVNQVLAGIADPGTQAAIRVSLRELVSGLRTIVIVTAVVGVAAGVLGFLAGDSRVARTVRHGGAVSRHETVWHVAGALVGVVVLASMDLTWLALLVVLAAIAVYEVAVYLIARRGQPAADGTPAVPGAASTAAPAV